MARLPDPITDRLMAEWPEEAEWKVRRKDLFSMIGESVRKAKSKEKKNGDGKEV